MFFHGRRHGEQASRRVSYFLNWKQHTSSKHYHSMCIYIVNSYVILIVSLEQSTGGACRIPRLYSPWLANRWGRVDGGFTGRRVVFLTLRLSLKQNGNLGPWTLPSGVHVMLFMMLLGRSERDGFLCLYRPGGPQKRRGWIDSGWRRQKKPNWPTLPVSPRRVGPNHAPLLLFFHTFDLKLGKITGSEILQRWLLTIWRYSLIKSRR